MGRCKKQHLLTTYSLQDGSLLLLRPFFMTMLFSLPQSRLFTIVQATMRRPQAVAFSLLLSLSLLLYTPAAAFLCPTSPRLPTKTSRLVCTACNKQSPSQEPSSYVRAPQPGVKTKSSSGFLEATALLTVAGLVAAPATVWALDW